MRKLVPMYDVSFFGLEWQEHEKMRCQLEGIEACMALLNRWRRCQLNCSKVDIAHEDYPCMQGIAAITFVYSPVLVKERAT